MFRKLTTPLPRLAWCCMFACGLLAAGTTWAAELAIALGEAPTLQEARAAKELQHLCAAHPDAAARLLQLAPGGVVLGTPQTNRVIGNAADELRVQELQHDGFGIGRRTADPRRLVLYSPEPRGVIYAAHQLFESLRLDREVTTRTSPAFRQRWLYNWQSMSGPYIHPPYDRTRTVFDFSNLGAANFPSSELARFFHRLAQMRINGMVLVNQLHDGPILNYLDHQPEMNRLLGLCKEYGLEVYLYGWLDPHERLDACPFNPGFREFWTSATTQLKQAMPAVDGLLLNRFRNARNLYARECEHCRGKSPDDRLQEAERVLCGILAPHGMKLIQDLCTDDYTRIDREVGFVGDPRVAVPANTYRNNRGAYLEPGDPPCPIHPLLYALQPGQPNTKHVIFNEQIFPEMRGKEFTPSTMARRWEQFLPQFRDHGVETIMGISETHPPQWDLAAADWYAFGRQVWNPDVGYMNVFRDWARLEHGAASVEKIARILHLAQDVSMHMYFAGGAREAPLSMLLPLESTDVFLAGGVCGTPKAPDGHVGIKAPLDMYPPAVARAIQADPATQLLFNQVKLDDALVARLMGEKQQAIRGLEEIERLWVGLQPTLDPKAYASQLQRIQLSRTDAQIWAVHLELYLDFKRGTLTAAKLDRMEAQYGGLVGSPLTGGSYRLLPEHYLAETRDPGPAYPMVRTLRQYMQQLRELDYSMQSEAARKLRDTYEWGRWPE